MRIRTAAGLLASGLTLTLGTATALPATAGAADQPGPSDRAAPKAKVARAALAEVEATLAGEADGGVEGRRDLTLALRDLFVAKDSLRGEERAAAENLLLRPTTPPDDPTDPRDIYYGEDADLQTQCGDTFCLHWVEVGEHATTPEFAATAFETIGHVAEVYAAAGFRAPLPDEGQEGDTRTDFYLGDIDQYGALGFCRSDADGPVVGSAWYGYCGFDNDYANSPWLDPTSLLQVTVAHEYFHAVQFAYDAEDDGWLMESTATAMEDELYDDVNDNAFFLNFGQMGDPEAFGYPLAGPSTPLDTFDLTAYGNWGFWRYLTEQHADETAGVPDRSARSGRRSTPRRAPTRPSRCRHSTRCSPPAAPRRRRNTSRSRPPTSTPPTSTRRRSSSSTRRHRTPSRRSSSPARHPPRRAPPSSTTSPAPPARCSPSRAAASSGCASLSGTRASVGRPSRSTGSTAPPPRRTWRSTPTAWVA
jgi:hypothetical protein